MKARGSYFSILRQQNKTLYGVVLAFTLLSVLTSLTKNEITPFYTWSMYARPVPNDSEFVFYELRYNRGKVFNIPETWKDHKKVMFYYPVLQYMREKENNGVDPDFEKVAGWMSRFHLGYASRLAPLYDRQKDIEHYPAWLKEYMQANLGERIDSMKLYRMQVVFDKGDVRLKSSKLIFNI